MNHAAFALLGGAGALIVTTVLITAAGALALMRHDLVGGGDGERVRGYEACELPGVDLDDLSDIERGYHLRRLSLCLDLEHERISRVTYEDELMMLHDELSVALDSRTGDIIRLDDDDDWEDDTEWEDCVASCDDEDCYEDCDAEDGAEGVVITESRMEIFADSVRAYSSEYGEDSWSAHKVLGAPDVYPSHGDDSKAWASKTEDAEVEFIEVAFGVEPTHMSAVNIYETYNVGAVSRVLLVHEGGDTTAVHEARAAAPGAGPHARIHRVEFACSPRPVIGVRVVLDSPAVPGWNEIDAISAEPCEPKHPLMRILE